MYTSLGISIVVFGLIAIRQWLPAWVRIWHVMTAGAAAALILGEISPEAALAAIDWDVILYLFGVFAIAASLQVNGLSERLVEVISGRLDLRRWGLLALMLATAATAAILTNDAAAVVGTPLALVLAKALQKPPTVPLIALCAAATIGSLPTPIGNPQNVLIAARGDFADPIGIFFSWLAVPAAASFVVAYLWLARCLARQPAVADRPLRLPRPDRPRIWPAVTATCLLIALVAMHSLLRGSEQAAWLSLGIVGCLVALPVLAFDRHRLATLAAVDWPTLAFFAAMFVVTSAVLGSGLLQDWLAPVRGQLQEPTLVFALGFAASQLFSNVPTVEIYLNLMEKPGAEAAMLLAASSTLAGNLFILSAASNVIVVQQAERLGVRPFGFWRFFALMLPITVSSLALAYLWLVWRIG